MQRDVHPIAARLGEQDEQVAVFVGMDDQAYGQYCFISADHNAIAYKLDFPVCHVDAVVLWIRYGCGTLCRSCRGAMNQRHGKSHGKDKAE